MRVLFPEARFVHIVRDGRAVAFSLLQQSWWLGWRGPENWRWGPLPENYQKEWYKYDRSSLVLAAIQWKILLDATDDAAKKLEKGQFLEIKYEDLCENPLSVITKVTQHSSLSESQKFLGMVSKMNLKNQNYKYVEALSSEQISILNHVLNSHLKKRGYSF